MTLEDLVRPATPAPPADTAAAAEPARHPFLVALGERVRTLRSRRGLTRKAVAQAMHGLVIKKDKYPGVIMDVRYDETGEIDRDSFLVEVKAGRQTVVQTLPPLNPIK